MMERRRRVFLTWSRRWRGAYSEKICDEQATMTMAERPKYSFQHLLNTTLGPMTMLCPYASRRVACCVNSNCSSGGPDTQYRGRVSDFNRREEVHERNRFRDRCSRNTERFTSFSA